MFSLGEICNKKNYITQLEDQDIKRICSIIDTFSLKDEIGMLFDNTESEYQLPGNYLIKKSSSGKCRIVKDNKTIVRCCDEELLCHYLNNKICEKKKLSSIKKKEHGLVLCGGGARGAYQIGVYKALEEYSDYNFTGISGVSVGSLNSLLIAQRDVDRAEETWLNVKQKDLTDLSDMTEKIIRCGINMIPYVFNPGLAFGSVEKVAMTVVQSIAENVAKNNAIEDEENQNRILRYKLFDNNLRNIIANSIYDWDSINRKKIVYACISNTSKESFIPLTGLSPDEIIKAVLVSACHPLAYGDRIYKGKKYVDGGLKNNVPYQPLTTNGFRKVIVVHLDQNDAKKTKKGYNASSHGDAQLVHIYPSESLGPVFSISQDLTRKRMELGYNDAKMWLNSGLIES